MRRRMAARRSIGRQPRQQGRYVRAWQPKRIPPGWNNLRMRVPHRVATCEEVDCPRFQRGWTDAPGGPFIGEREGTRYEPGTRCPLVHTVPDERYTPLYVYNDSKGAERQITEDEFRQRTGEGAYTLQFIKERGL